MANYKLLALDLDGTLTDSKKQISPLTKKRIDQAILAGVRIILVSGRPLLGVVPVAEELNLYTRGGFLAAANGGSVYDCGTGHMLFQATVPPAYYHIICQTPKVIPGLSVLTYDSQGIVSDHADAAYVRMEAYNNSAACRQAENLEADCGLEPKQKFIIAGEAEPLAMAYQYLKERLNGLQEIYYSTPYYVEVAPLGAEKAAAVERIVHYTGCVRQDLMACGDGLNDIRMLDYAGFAVAMENGCDEIKEHADFISPSNDRDGVAVAIERYLL